MAEGTFTIGPEGFEVVGTEMGGWVVMRSRNAARAGFCTEPFVAAFSTFDEMLTWLGKQVRKEVGGIVAGAPL